MYLILEIKELTEGVNALIVVIFIAAVVVIVSTAGHTALRIVVTPMGVSSNLRFLANVRGEGREFNAKSKLKPRGERAAIIQLR